MSKVFIFGDIHFPYHSKTALNKAFKALANEKPDIVIQVGDLLDMYSFSKFPKSANYTTPKKELDKGLNLVRQFWLRVQHTCPNARCIQLLGNHDARLFKRISEKLPEVEHLVSIGQLYNFKKVEVMKSDRNFVQIDGVVYCHGFLSQSYSHVTKHFAKPVVHGHLHRPCLITQGKLWSMDVGYLADPTKLPMQYTQTKLSQWRHAVGVVTDGVPKLILL